MRKIVLLVAVMGMVGAGMPKSASAWFYPSAAWAGKQQWLIRFVDWSTSPPEQYWRAGPVGDPKGSDDPASGQGMQDPHLGDQMAP